MQKRRFASPGLCLAAAVVLGGCAIQRALQSDLPVRELAGHYISGKGDSWFRPCDAVAGDPSWWVTVTGRAVDQMERARSAGQFVPGERYFVRWRAAVTTEGKIGPQGQGVPALLVRELLELRAGTEADCIEREEAPGPTSH